MKERPTLFSTPMVEANLDDRKTQTRRVIKKLIVDEDSGYTYFGKHQFDIHQWKDQIIEFCPYGQVGDLLWVRETWNQDGDEFFFKAGSDINLVGWKPSIHMPKAAARIWLEITGVRVERLQDITEEDAEKEGVHFGFTYPNSLTYYGFKNYSTGINDLPDARQSFTSLWESINPGSWESNPWVWVIEYKRIEKEKP